MAKNMTTREIVQELVNKGYSVKYRVRKDGGVLIASINNQKFTAAAGNKVARQIVGQDISQARKTQLEKITRERTDAQFLYKEYMKVRRKWKKNVSDRAKGEVTFKKVKYQLKDKGREETLKYLSEKNRYAEGFAYTEVINALIDEINKTISSLEGAGYVAIPLRNLVDRIKANKAIIRDEDILPAYEELYRLTKTQQYGPVTPERIEEVARNVERILKI